MRYENGPFRYLNNQWDFLPHPTGCEVDFFVDFEFRSRILQAAIGVVFNEAVRRMVGAFNKRARAGLRSPRRCRCPARTREELTHAALRPEAPRPPTCRRCG